MSKKDDTLNNYIMMAEILLRITALEKILLDKQVFSKEELLNVIETVSADAAKNVLKNVSSNKDIDEVINSFKHKEDHKQKN